MKKIFFLLSFFSLFNLSGFANPSDFYAFSPHPHYGHIEIVVSDVPGGEQDVSMTVNNLPPQISQTDYVIFHVIVQNNSIACTPEFNLDMIQSSGWHVNVSTCNEYRGGLGGVVIPPVCTSGTQTFTFQQLTLPVDGPANLLTGGANAFDFDLFEQSSGKWLASSVLNLNISVPSQDPLRHCNTGRLVAETSKKISIYPNPFTDTVRFDVSNQKFSSSVLLEIYNNKGILSDSKIYRGKQLQELEYQNNGLRSGVYYYKIISQDQVINGTLIRK
ncbi:T9SS type A sorting domain-containing protein [Aureisphaera galaxeae]|uniref:T9SS type A sorting domain-containing protein n=1 Tax=Aureisphaera galaxeae TaxID=1538023 RepID=UPI002350DD46|nr:T9SS type A sorting domain-containing protein [Aureisphaera galaxeae]MDC8002865.1 T9SS type A sorting domain-containing protein [Aureisphaera galaxeae]